MKIWRGVRYIQLAPSQRLKTLNGMQNSAREVQATYSMLNEPSLKAREKQRNAYLKKTQANRYMQFNLLKYITKYVNDQ